MLSEIVGYRSGLALSTMKMRKLLAEDAEGEHAWPRRPEDGMRVRAEDFEQTVRFLLYRLGRLRTPSMLEPYRWLHAMMKDPKRSRMVPDLIRWLGDATQERRPGAPIDLRPVFEKAADAYGYAGFQMAKEFYDEAIEHMHGSTFGKFRAIEWKDIVELDALFKNENLVTDGEFFDQRFIDYLHRNFGDITKIHWRQFERLTAEYFAKEGFRVKLSPGRKDNGIDVRVWRDGGTAPTIMIQCKRQKDDVEQVVLKALYADLSTREQRAASS
jgi:restriction system protein